MDDENGKGPPTAQVIPLGRATYDANSIDLLLSGLGPVPAEQVTVHGDHTCLPATEFAELCSWLRRNKGVWSVRLLSADGQDLLVHRGDLPPCRLLREAPVARARNGLTLIGCGAASGSNDSEIPE